MKKIKFHQIILAHDLTALKFSDLFTVYFFEIRSNGRQRFDESKIGSSSISWEDESVKGPVMFKGEPKWSP